MQRPWREEILMPARFKGKAALVTGGASGIGKVAALTFAREGASVVVATDANIKGGEETVKLIKEAGGQAIFARCDVAKAGEVEAMIDKCVQQYGRLDYAFNNAGIGPDGKRVPVVNIVDCPEEVWDRTIGINLKGVFLCMKYEMRQMLKQKHGVIVNTSSVGALKPVRGFCAYAASKSGLIGLTKTAALEGADSGIRVNTILPGPTERTLLFEYLTGTQPEVKEQMANMIPMKRVARPEEMAEAVMWLCSDEASFITGHVMPVDGGMTSQ
jgi:NAD(P)-dependent dehydrogenase (short-subunit alcohol dehydrogenase family)